MEQRTRRWLQWGAWCAFLVGGPLVLAYARGYRLPLTPAGDWRVPPGPAVGAVVVRTIPRGAALAIDGKPVDERTPTGLGNIAVGPRVLRVTKAEYRPWEKRVEILGGRVHHFLFVRLIPEQLPEESIRAGVDAVWGSASGKWTVTREGQRLHFFRADRWDQDVGAVHLSGVPRSSTIGLHWAPSEEALAVTTTPSPLDQRLLGLIDLKTYRFLPIEGGPRFAGWVSGREDRAVTLTAGGQLEARSLSATKPVVLAEKVTAAGTHPRGVVFARVTGDANAPVLSLFDGASSTTLDASPPPGGVHALQAAANGAVAAVLADGSLVVRPRDENAWLSVGSGSPWFSWAPDGSTVLFQSSPYELALFPLAKDAPFLSPREPALLVRSSTPLASVRWFPDSLHVLFIERDILFLADVDGRGGHRLEPLLQTNLGPVTVAVPATGASLLLPAQRGGERVLVRAHLLTPDDERPRTP